MSITVFTPEEILEAIRSNGITTLSAEKKKDDKAYKGTRFLNLYWNGIKTSKGKLENRAEGWFHIENVVLSDGVADPDNDKDKRNEFKGTRLQLPTTVSRAGSIGQVLALLNPIYIGLINKLISEGTINLGNRKIHELIQTTLSENNEKNPNGKIDDPVIRFKVDFSCFPQKYKHKFLIGHPRTVFYDARTAYEDERGITQYKIAMVKDPKTGSDVPVCEDNLHLFVTKGSVIVKGRITIPSIAISQSWVSAPILINRAVIMPGADEGFSDEIPSAVPEIPVITPNIVTEPAAVVPVVHPMNNDEIDELLNL